MPKDENSTWNWIFRICLILIPIQTALTAWVFLQILSLSNFRARTEVILSQGIPPRWVMNMIDDNTKQLSDLNSTLLKFALANEHDTQKN